MLVLFLRSFPLVLALFVSFVLPFSISAGEQLDGNAKPKVKVLCSILPVYIFTSNITKGINNVSLSLLVQQQTGCPHDYSLTPGDLKKISEADVLIVSGAGIEPFLPDNLSALYPNLKIIDSSKGISDLIEDDEEEHKKHETAEHHEEEKHNESHDHGEHNPHIWASPKQAVFQVSTISSGLSAIDSSNRELYSKNADAYIVELNNISDELKTVIDTIKNKNVVAIHSTFAYFARDFGLNVVATVYPISEHELSPSDITNVIEAAKKNKAQAIITEPQYSAKSAELISSESGIPFFSLDPVINGSMEIDAYSNAMKANIKALKDNLGNK